LTIPQDWNIITPEEASKMLFMRIVELHLTSKGYLIAADPTVRILTQRLYGDYRQVHLTQEYKRAEKHVYFYKNTGLGKELF
jgi:uncharacterized lipoprotein YajG